MLSLSSSLDAYSEAIVALHGRPRLVDALSFAFLRFTWRGMCDREHMPVTCDREDLNTTTSIIDFFV